MEISQSPVSEGVVSRGLSSQSQISKVCSPKVSSARVDRLKVWSLSQGLTLLNLAYLHLASCALSLQGLYSQSQVSQGLSSSYVSCWSPMVSQDLFSQGPLGVSLLRACSFSVCPLEDLIGLLESVFTWSPFSVFGLSGLSSHGLLPWGLVCHGLSFGSNILCSG